MRFKSILIKNYRQYRNVEISFDYKDKTKNLIVIEGANGAGKTNFLNAITWCLYDNEEHLSVKDKGLPIINNIIFSGLKDHQSAEVLVKLTMESEDGKREIFERNMEAIKERGNNLPRYGKSELKVLIKGKEDKDWKISEEPAYRVDRLLPKDIQEYFLFDGERLEKYFSRGARRGLKKEVYEVSQLDLFDNVIEHLEKMKNDYQKDIADVNPRANEIKTRLDRKTDELTGERKVLSQVEAELRQAAEQEEELFEDLKKLPLSIEKIEELKSKKQMLEKKAKFLEDEINELRQEHLDYLLEYSKIILTYEGIKKAKDMISQKVEKGEIPPEYKKEFVEKLLEKNICICGTEIKQGKARDNIEKLLKECSELDEISQELIREDHNFRLILEKVKRFRDGQLKLSKNILSREDEYNNNSSELDKVEKQLFNIDDEEVRKLEKRYRIAKKKKEELRESIGEKRYQIKISENEISKMERDFAIEVKKTEKHEQLKSSLEFSRECIDIAKEIMDSVKDEIKEAIEKKTKDQFLATIWKKQTYKDVIIDDDYDNISVLDQNAMESIGTLSKGESHFLALSFVNALHLVSGFKTPIVIDTPLGRISGEPKLNLAKVLPEFTKEKQIILLVTDQEYTPEIKRALKGSVAKEFKINFIESKHGCEAEVKTYEEETR